ncbi:putative malate dehydrogenase 1B [Anticarsia gemmatalis]|uniref:putative malate dehydrogenase 1B n=1 Tax=Anticarsia gemmatalis TaxID=129554 RepID=UPI003F771433
MVFRIVIAGESQCLSFAESCLVADFLSQNLPDFCYDRVEVPVLEWQAWLCATNLKYKWHHVGSPIVWKDMLMAGSKPLYIGGGPQFLDYCYSYYNFDSFFASDQSEDLVKNIVQYKKHVAKEKRIQLEEEIKCPAPKPAKKHFTVTISGAGNPLTMHLLSGLLEMDIDDQTISKIFIYDENCTEDFLLSVERECAFIETYHPGKVVKYVDRLGMALTSTDLMIIQDHVPFKEDMAIGEWLLANRKIMNKLALVINASGARKMYVVFANLGPACFNATVLRENVNISKNHIVVATSDLGLEILPIAAEIAEVPSRNIFCPPVWGFVGINHIVDIRTTVHRYDTFEPYNRYTRVKNSSLKIGKITPELRTLEYLMYFDETLWVKVAEAKNKYPMKRPYLNKSIVVLNLIKLWLFIANPKDIVNLGLYCNGSFGLHFDGIFSQPARLVNGEWVSATDYLLPKDPQMSLYYLEKMAVMIMQLQRDALPPLVPYYPCTCKPKPYKKKKLRIW